MRAASKARAEKVNIGWRSKQHLDASTVPEYQSGILLQSGKHCQEEKIGMEKRL